MTRILGAAILLGTVFAIIWLSAVRPERNPLLIDASASWCGFQHQPPLVTEPPKYDHRLQRRHIGSEA